MQSVRSLSTNGDQTFGVKPDGDLQKEPTSTVEACAKRFLAKGGTIESIAGVDVTKRVKLPRGAAIYPVCSGGSFRSQSVWAHLKKFEPQIVLLPPHSANHGFDPYNGRTNRDRSHERDESLDEFAKHFGMQKSLRAGFENQAEWLKIAANPTKEGLQKITHYYDQHYFGPHIAQARIYVVFDKNAHIVMHRLDAANKSLENVTIIAINVDDIISKPPAHLNAAARSARAYAHFEDFLTKLLDTTELAKE